METANFNAKLFNIFLNL